MTSMMMDYGARPEDVGEILVRVQEDLQSLREKLLVQGGGGREVDLSVIQEALDKTEEGIRQKTEQVVTQLNNRVLTLPSLEAQQARREEQQPYVSVETTWDLRANSRGNFGVRRTGMDRLGLLESRDMGRQVVPPAPPVPTTQMRKIPEKKLGQETMQMAGPTPGQMRGGTVQLNSKQLWTQRVLYNPYNPRNREVMSDSYGIQLPLIADRTSQKSLGNQVAKGSTVEPLAVLPRANRVDPQLVPPAITEDDAQKGILSLIERGLIPPAADLTLDPNPVRHKVAPLHNPKEKDKSQAQPASNEGTFNLASVRFDPSTKPGDGEHPAASTKLPSPSPDVAVKSRISSGRVGSAQKVAKTPLAVKTVEMPLHPLPPPTTPASGDFKDRHHRFAIQHGKVRDLSQEFLAFKQHYCLSWGSIVTMLKHLEKMLVSYAVPIAFIHGDKLADLSLEFELEKAPSVDDMLSVIVNREDVESIIRRPGRRFIGPNGEDLAAAKIQATFKAYCERLRYLDYRRRKWAAGVIAISWVMNVKMAKVRKQLVTTRKDQLEAFRIRAKTFAKSWDRIQSSKRVIIHIPSLGHSQHIRNTIDDFGIRQNMQMARLCDTRDPNVDVIYVSPVSVNDETFQYYTKLLGLKAAIESGNVEDQAEVTDRYKIITPEGTKSFPTHHMCLSTHLKYSPRAIKRIKNLIRGREAYIVTGHPHVDDLSVASELDVPILCPEPEVAHLYSTKSGSKRIFASACVEVPPGEFDVYSLPQLHECLAQLVTENLDVRRWLFKLDDEFDGRGIAYCDIADHMRCYPWALKEAQRYGEKWSKKWAQEAAYIKIHAEIPDVLVKHATPVNTTVYKNWDKFLQAFLSQGGVIEACPPSDSVTNLTANMLIEPNGRISLVSMGDQIHALSQFQCWGMSVPQSSVEPDQLNDVCFRVAEACKARGVVGYFAIDLVTFIESKTMEQKLWATDLNLSYDDSLAMFHLMQYVTHGTLDMKTHFFDIPTPKREEKKSRRRRQQEDEVAPNTNRYAVMSTHLRHTNLSVVHYSVFFQMCRAHGIGYDIKEKQGTVFTLIDSFNRENLGMLTVGDNLQGALATFARNLSVIHQEISAPNMQGHSNFQFVIDDIESILGTTIQNAEEQEEEVQDVE